MFGEVRVPNSFALLEVSLASWSLFFLALQRQFCWKIRDLLHSSTVWHIWFQPDYSRLQHRFSRFRWNPFESVEDYDKRV